MAELCFVLTYRFTLVLVICYFHHASVGPVYTISSGEVKRCSLHRHTFCWRFGTQMTNLSENLTYSPYCKYLIWDYEAAGQRAIDWRTVEYFHFWRRLFSLRTCADLSCKSVLYGSLTGRKCSETWMTATCSEVAWSASLENRLP